MAEQSFTLGFGSRSSLTAQGGLRRASETLSQSLQRLSSGQRINNASDDAAGLALASSLKAESRIYSKAVQNMNDAISYANYASSGLEALLEISTRAQELAQQAMSETLSDSQRQSMQEEADALVEEFNRIVSSSSWNGMNPFAGSMSGIQVQAGTGAQAAFKIMGLEEGFTRTVGTGYFTQTGEISGAGDSAREVNLIDINKDGKLDLVYTTHEDSLMHVALGNGDGTFGAQTCYTVGAGPENMAIADYDKDGNLDIVVANADSQDLSYLSGHGDGTFDSPTTMSGMTWLYGVQTADLNGDSYADLILNNGSFGLSLGVALNKGDGTFDPIVSYQGASTPHGCVLTDVNNDGKVDVVVSNMNSNSVVYLGNGDGTFQAFVTVPTGNTDFVTAGDFNLDGNMDLAFTGGWLSDTMLVVLGNGDNTYKAAQTYSTGVYPKGIAASDMNGDGILDLVESNNEGSVGVYLGRGDGTFQTPLTVQTGVIVFAPGIGDVNGDGVPDMMVPDNTTSKILVCIGVSEQVGTLGYLNLLSAGSAAISYEAAAETVERVTIGQGLVAADTSRLSVALRNSQSVQIGAESGHEKIMDVDTAEEVAKMVRSQILVDASVALCAQANLESALVLKLIADK